MKRALIFLAVIFVLAIGSYYFWSLKDKDLKFIPNNADAVILIDVKAFSEQYILTLIKYPSKWFGTSKVSSKSNGIKVPDYIQIFHLKNAGFNQWYSIFEISDKDDLLNFLREKGFKLNNHIYTKDQFSVKIEALKCVVGFSNPNFEKTTNEIIGSKTGNFHADQLINNSVASISYLAQSKIHKFAVYINDDDIEIKTKTVDDVFSSMISGLDKQTRFLKLNLDSTNIKITSELSNKKLSDSIKINSVSAVAELEMVNDKIVSYSYDDNFNEVEKVSYQKILQPNYFINLQSSEVEKTWSYFQNKKWINAQNQFTLIPFQPNLINKNANIITIQSTRKSVELGKSLSGNFIFLKNNPLLINSIKSISSSEKKIISKMDYLFYGNKSQNYYLKLKFKKEEFPLILRL